MPKTSLNCFITFYPYYKEIPGIIVYVYNPLLPRPPSQLLFLLDDQSKYVVKFDIYHLHYKKKEEMVEFAYNLPLIQLSSKQILLSGALFDFVVKSTHHHLHYKEKMEIIESAYKPFLLWSPLQPSLPPNDQPDYVGQFTTYHPHYKEKLIMTESAQNSILFQLPSQLLLLLIDLSDHIIRSDYLQSSCSLNNLLVARICTIELGLVMEKGELPKTCLYLLFYPPPSLSFSLTSSNICPTMFEYFLMSKSTAMSHQYLSLTLTAKLITKDCKYFTFARYLLEVTFDHFRATSTIGPLLDNIALLNKQLRQQINNKSKKQYYDQNNLCFLIAKLYLMTHRFSIKKQYWERYQIV